MQNINYSVLDICQVTPVIPMPAGTIMRLVAMSVKNIPKQHPITFENWKRYKDRYMSIASIEN